MTRKSNITTIVRHGIVAVIAVAAFVGAGALNPAQAAGYIKFDGVDGEAAVTIDEMGVKSAELEAELAKLQEQMDRCAALSAELQTLGGDLVGHSEEARKGNVEFEWKVEEGERVFDEQVAPLLDADIVQQVKEALQKVRVATGDVDGDGAADIDISSSLEALSSALEACRASCDELSQTGKSSLDILKRIDKSSPLLYK